MDVDHFLRESSDAGPATRDGSGFACSLPPARRHRRRSITRDVVAVARQFGVWCHVDWAMADLFQLTQRGRSRDGAGIEAGDSITFGPAQNHCSLPLGTGRSCPRSTRASRNLGGRDADYMRDLAHCGSRTRTFNGLPDFRTLVVAGVDPCSSRSRLARVLVVRLHLHRASAAFAAKLRIEKTQISRRTFINYARSGMNVWTFAVGNRTERVVFILRGGDVRRAQTFGSCNGFMIASRYPFCELAATCVNHRHRFCGVAILVDAERSLLLLTERVPSIYRSSSIG